MSAGRGWVSAFALCVLLLQSWRGFASGFSFWPFVGYTMFAAPGRHTVLLVGTTRRGTRTRLLGRREFGLLPNELAIRLETFEPRASADPAGLRRDLEELRRVANRSRPGEEAFVRLALVRVEAGARGEPAESRLLAEASAP
jgi:hypothetical protein